MNRNMLYENESSLAKRAVFFLMIVLTLSSGCKPYVGLQVDTSNWKSYLPGLTYYIHTDHFEFEIKITETGNKNEYLMEGTLDGSRGSLKSIGKLVEQDCVFRIVLARNNVVIDTISFFPDGSDYLNKLPFKRIFTAEPFDSLTVVYEVSVIG